MNLRIFWTELFQKPAGRLFLFLLVGAIFIAFLLARREPKLHPDNTPVAGQGAATKAKGYSFENEIPPPPPARAQPPEPLVPKPQRPAPETKPPPPIPQTIFAVKEPPRSHQYLPYGRLLRCELVNTVDSTNIDTPIIGLVLEDLWHAGRMIIPAGTEVHGVAQKTAARERIGSDRQWRVVFHDGRELPVSGAVLDYAPIPEQPDQWEEADGSAGLRGFIIKTDKYAELKVMLATMISGTAGAFPETINQISPVTGSTTQLRQGGYQDAFAAGLEAGGKLYSQRLLDKLERDPYYIRVPAGTLFYLYLTQTVDLAQATTGLTTPKQTPQPQ
jgi:hypothetical protein